MEHIVINEPLRLYKNETAIVACIGYFDGLHLGHQKLIEKSISIAKEKSMKSALITFDPDPWTVINNNTHVKHLTPMKEKLVVAETLGIDQLITIKFSKDFAKLSPQEFIESVLVPLNVNVLVCGSDYRFGYKGAGNVSYLKDHANYYFDTCVVEIDVNEKKIGTTAITQALLSGNVESANNMLGRYYQISGFVVDGDKRGRELGFPTANIDVVDEYVIPKSGVYAGYVCVDTKQYRSLISIGTNPTFTDRDHVSIESYILDFNEDIYGSVIKQNFVALLRSEEKFNSVDELVTQMNLDVKNAVDIFNDLES